MGRDITELARGWRFIREDAANGADPTCDDSGWQAVTVPHDWAIAGPFDRENDIQYTRIVADGETQMYDHTGRTGGLPHVGVGWYRLCLTLPESALGRRVFLEFDGVMSHSRVFFNGQEIGSWPYGYSSFSFEVTDAANFGGENVLAVQVDNKPLASRWYPGAGIYRRVRLVTTAPVHVAHWGTYITTPQISAESAQVRVQTRLQNQSGRPAEVTLETTLLAPDGSRVAGDSVTATMGDEQTFTQALAVATPVLWSLEQPACYRAVSVVRVDGEEVDRYETPFGIREMRFTALDGCFLNGKRVTLQGVCMHHDLGALGAAINTRALERQLEILQEMGCNAIRTSHNPPAPELLDLCDRMGFLVLDEAFDEWRLPKMENGYHLLFDAWAEKDMRAMIRRDRNHPCVIMWSIGNEIPEQGDPNGAQVARFLTDICHEEDPTRPVTAGFNQSDNAILNGLADVVDIPGWNYKPFKYAEYRRAHPEWIMYGSETASCVSSRGVYFFPVEEAHGPQDASLQISSYDLHSPKWGYLPEYEFAGLDDNSSYLGEFVWTGFDYLGEPTPYNHEWPSRSSYFGIVDLCGLPKDRFYLYQSRWSTKPVLHLLPHWTWPGRESEVTPVHCYTNYPAAELFLNGRSLGIRRKNPERPVGRYRLVWDDVRYEPGTLKVVALDDDGRPVAEAEVQTAGDPARIALTPDRTVICANSEDLSFITVQVLDAQGVLCPDADQSIAFTVEGPGRIVAVDNGDATSVEPFQASTRKAFHGQCMLIIGTNPAETGAVRVTATAPGLAPGHAVVTVSATGADGPV